MREPIHSKSDALVHVHKRHTKREPSLTVGLAIISWMALSLLALVKQKQHAKTSPKCHVC